MMIKQIINRNVVYTFYLGNIGCANSHIRYNRIPASGWSWRGALTCVGYQVTQCKGKKVLYSR